MRWWRLCNPPHPYDGRSIFAPASVGRAPAARAIPLALIENAELALVAAKRQGGACALVYRRAWKPARAPTAWRWKPICAMR